jgi:peptidoglycan/LPS O-acetylase OafA/YrhL
MPLLDQRLVHADAKHNSFPLFDWLRFALASVVALSHEDVVTWPHAGNLAVQVFFALSGWLIGGILLSTARRGLPRFYYNRATRIWAPYAIAVAALYGVAAVKEGIAADWLRCLFFDATFTHNWFINPVAAMPLGGTGNHFWSIAVEEQFYLAAPLLIVVLPFGRSITFWTLLAAVAVLTGSWYGAISLGVLAAVVRARHGTFPAIIAALCAAGLAAAMIALPALYVLLAPLLAVSVVLTVSKEGRRSAAGEFAGAVSYPLYLYHWIGMFAANLLFRGSPVVGLVAYALAVAGGVAAYLLIDRNVMALRARLYSPRIGRAVMATAYALLGLGVVGGLTSR